MTKIIQFQKYIIHLTYCLSIVIATCIFVSYKVWSNQQLVTQLANAQEQLKIQKEERNLKISQCLNTAKITYNNAIANACVGFKSVAHCLNGISMIAPKRLELLTTEFDKDRDLCIKTNS